MNTRVKQSMIDHARAVPTEEVCGLVYHTEDSVYAYPCANVSMDGRDESFEIAPDDYVAATVLGKVCGVYHGGMTHTNEGFSEADIATANGLCLPMHAVSAAGNVATYVPDSYHVDPVGLPFIWGLYDCLTSVVLHYRQTRAVTITDYDRDETFARATPDAITRHIEAEGFTHSSLPFLTKDDVLLFTTPGGAHAHHLGVYMGGNRFLHHPLGSLSRIDYLDDAWLRRVSSVLRYTR